jgi:hypothetical protein
MPPSKSVLTAKAIATLRTLWTIQERHRRPALGAATTVLDRGWGRPTQSIEGNVKPFSLADLVYMSMKDREPQPESKLIEGDVKVER